MDNVMKDIKKLKVQKQQKDNMEGKHEKIPELIIKKRKYTKTEIEQFELVIQ